MDVAIKIVPCIKCGGKGYLYYETKYNTYFIKCENCGNRSMTLLHLENAIISWNKSNTPAKMKPTYHCGKCDAEIHLGFSECPKCKTEIDWN